MTTEKIVISRTKYGVWSALLRDSRVLELAFDRHGEFIQVGNIFRGKVSRILPGLNGAFIDIGFTKNGFIHSRDVLVRSQVAVEDDLRTESPIHLNLREGELLLVQVTKEAIGSKPFRLSSNLSLAGRNLVYTPKRSGIRISRRLDFEEDHQRLKNILIKLKEKKVFSDVDGFIVRSNGKNASEEQFFAEIETLQNQWGEIKKASNLMNGVGLLYANRARAIEFLRDRLGSSALEVLVDDDTLYEQACELIQTQLARQEIAVKKYRGAISLFKKFDLDQVVDNICRRNIALRSGGMIVIELTEALVSIDVNSARSEQKAPSSVVNLKTNLEAAREIAFQLRLRNLGGIIVIDFINMNSNADKEKLRNSFNYWLEDDPAKTTVHEISALGLLEMSRQRSRKSLFEIFHERCSECDGLGLRQSTKVIGN